MLVNKFSFYKVVVLDVGIFETVIIDERNFGEYEDAQHFVDERMKSVVTENLTAMILSI